ncbi:MAG: 5-(carboxyamino)imidazole ribonucleotide mutase [Myxococcales bacterium]|nr:5-(carboxyamino)imidazole ribonucleotide mutase [Myxococcales bacterium]
MGSKNDWETMQHAAEVLASFEVAHECRVVSAHRTPRWLVDYASSAESRGLQVIIAGAGGAAHLPGMVASETLLPVIGVPIAGQALRGLDSLLSIVQMPRGVPVATVAINNATNAGLLAARIIGLADERVAAAVRAAQTDQRAMAHDADTRVSGEFSPPG